MRIGLGLILIFLGIGQRTEAWWLRAFPGYAPNGDTLWSDTSSGAHGPRLAIGNGAYLANGKTMLIWQNQERDNWSQPDLRFTPPSERQKYSFQVPAPLATAGDLGTELVLWGNWRSRDRGAHWEPMPFPSTRFQTYGIRGSVCLGGGAGETIERSLDSGRTWKTVHQGTGQGFVKQFVFADSALVFAIAYPERVFVSKNGGMTWAEWTIPESLGLSGSRIQGIGFSFGQQIWNGPPAPRFLWSLHLDSATGRSRLVRHLIDSGRAEIVTQGLPDTLTCLSVDGRVFIGGGRDLYMVDYNGIIRKPFSLEHLPEGEVLTELHGNGDNFNSFALTKKFYYASYYEAIIAPRSKFARSRADALYPLGRLFRPDEDGRTNAYLADGRSISFPAPR